VSAIAPQGSDPKFNNQLGNGRQIEVVLNRFEELKQRVPVRSP